MVVVGLSSNVADRATSVSALLYIHQTTVEGGAPADIRQPIGCQHIDAAMVGRQFVPAYRRRQHHSLPHHAVHSRHQRATAAVIEDADPIATPDPARARILIVQK